MSLRRMSLYTCMAAMACLLALSCESAKDRADRLTVQTIHASDEPFNQHDADKYLTYYAPDFQWDLADAPARISRADFANVIAAMPKDSPTIYHLQDLVLASGDNVFLDGCRFIDENPVTKSRFTTFHSDWLIMEKGKIKVMTTYSDGATDPVALGQMEPPLPAPPLPGRRVYPTPSPKATNLGPAEAQKDAMARFNSHDPSSIATGLADNASILISPLYDPQNRSAYVAWLGLMFKAFPDLKVETIRSTTFKDGYAIDEVRMTGTNLGPYLGHQPTGKGFSLRSAWLGRYGKDGLVTSLHLYFDSLGLYTQIGLAGKK